MKNKKTKEEMVAEILQEVKEDIRQLEFGQVIIFVQNYCPSRKEVRNLKTFKTNLDKGS